MRPAWSRRKSPGSSLRRARSPVAPNRTMTWSAGVMAANVRPPARARIGDVPSLRPGTRSRAASARGGLSDLRWLVAALRTRVALRVRVDLLERPQRLAVDQHIDH